MLVRDKRSSLLRKFVIYGCKKFYNIGPWDCIEPAASFSIAVVIKLFCALFRCQDIKHYDTSLDNTVHKDAIHRDTQKLVQKQHSALDTQFTRLFIVTVLSIVMLRVIMLNVIMFRVIKWSVVASLLYALLQ